MDCAGCGVTAGPPWSKMERNAERKEVAESKMTGEDPALRHLPPRP